MIRKIKCKICSKDFEIEGQNNNGFFKAWVKPWNTKICSEECKKVNWLEHSKKQAIRNKKKIIKKKCRQCGKEVISNEYCPRNFCGGMSGECYKQFLSNSRKGKDNPAYRNGMRVGKNHYNSKHNRACIKYRKEFLVKNNYLFCEVCAVNSNGTPRFEVHHIYYASLFPKHKELHNPKNLILICIKCHNDFHSGKMRSKIFLKIEKERGLKELFANKKYGKFNKKGELL